MLPRWKPGEIFVHALAFFFNYVCVILCVFYFTFFRQTLTFLEIVVSLIIPISAEYLDHGSLHYEFSTETLWSPIQLTRISNPQA